MWTQIIGFKIINQWSIQYTGDGRIWHREENKYWLVEIKPTPSLHSEENLMWAELSTYRRTSSYSRENQSLCAHTNPFFTQTPKNAVIMLLSGKCGAATVVSSKTLIPCDTSAAYLLSLYSHTSESNSLNHPVIETVCELFLFNKSHSQAVVRMGNGRVPLHSHKGKSSYF